MMPIIKFITSPRPPAPTVRRPVPAFTLAELMTVLTIVAIFATMALPRFGASIARRRADAAALQIAADLKLARRHARITGVAQTVQFYPAQLRYELPAIASLNHPGQTYAVNLSQPPYEITALNVNCGGDSVIIYDMYGIPDSGGTISTLTGGELRTITINANTGEPSVSP